MALQGATVSPTSGVGNIQVQPTATAVTNVPVNTNANIQPVNTNTPAAGTDTTGGLGSLLSGVLGSAANTYGAQNAAENISQADQAAINTQTQTLGNINTLFQPQTTLGNTSMSALGKAEGLNGGAPDYSGFLNMPGYQFAVQQGTQAIQRQAAASGNAWTPNTGAAIGQYVTGTAMQDYNTYISQLQSNAQLGAAANQTLSGANLQVGGNISQLQQNSGMAQASGVSNAAGGISSFLNNGGLSTIGNIANGAANYLTGGTGGVSGAISNWLNGGVGVSASQTAGALSDVGATAASTAASDMAGISAGTDAALNAVSAGGVAGAGGAGAEIAGAGLYDTGGIDTMALAQSGYASLGGVPGAVADTSAGIGGGGEAAAAGGGSLGLGLVGAAAPIAAALYGATKPGVELGSSWYNNIGNSVGAAMGPNATVQQKLAAATQLQSLGLMQLNGQGSSGLSTANNFDMNRALQVLKPYGITTLAQAQALASSLLDSIPPGQMPGGNIGPGGRENTALMNSIGNLSGYIKPA